jgi:hypothetical protein
VVDEKNLPNGAVEGISAIAARRLQRGAQFANFFIGCNPPT